MAEGRLIESKVSIVQGYLLAAQLRLLYCQTLGYSRSQDWSLVQSWSWVPSPTLIQPGVLDWFLNRRQDLTRCLSPR